jgi:Zn finger protein HypA/HybF involved in hydrogenase expression
MGGNRAGAGPTGYCVCPKCGERVAHKVGKPCYEMTCPKCGAKMARE